MTPRNKARHFILYSLLFVSIVCQSFAAFGNTLKKTELLNLQIAENDNPREVLKKTLTASQSVKSYRVRIEVPSLSKAVTIMEYALPDRVRIFENNEETLWIDKTIYLKIDINSWRKHPGKTDRSMWTKHLKKERAIDLVLPATVLENLIKDLSQVEVIKFIGQETVDGIPTLAYQHIMRSDTTPYTMKTWIGVADGLLRRWEFACAVIDSIPLPIIYTYYDYNADIKIEPPVNITPGGAPGPPSAGPGEGRGMGSGTGTGIGSGKGGNMSSVSEFNPDGSAKSVDSRPQPLNRPRPNYTEEARNNKVQGNVRVRVLVGADGSVKQARIISGLSDGLNEEAILVVKQIRFKPAIKNGQPVAYWIPLDVEFNLR